MFSMGKTKNLTWQIGFERSRDVCRTTGGKTTIFLNANWERDFTIWCGFLLIETVRVVFSIIRRRSARITDDERTTLPATSVGPTRIIFKFRRDTVYSAFRTKRIMHLRFAQRGNAPSLSVLCLVVCAIGSDNGAGR